MVLHFFLSFFTEFKDWHIVKESRNLKKREVLKRQPSLYKIGGRAKSPSRHQVLIKLKVKHSVSLNIFKF